MVNNYSTISPVNTTSATLLQSTSASKSSTSDILGSFKEIFSTMMTQNSLSGTGEASSGMGMSDLMAPLMLLLLEQLIEKQLEGEGGDTSLTSRPTPSNRPVGGVLTQGFRPGHNGLDFGIVVGTPIKSTMDGEVVYAGWNNQGYGNLVIVQNGDYKTYYAHLSSIPVQVGDSVSAGSVIGLSGNTGNSTGPHLHYEIRKNNVPIDPTSLTLGS